MFGLEDRGFEVLAEFAVGVLTDPAVTVGVFVPEKVLLVTGLSHFERVGERFEFTGRIAHQVHLLSYSVAHRVDRGDEVAGISPLTAPDVELVGGITHVEAVGGEVGVRLGQVQSAVPIAQVEA